MSDRAVQIERDDAADAAALADPQTWAPPPSPEPPPGTAPVMPGNNIVVHERRTLNTRQNDMLRNVKDLALALINELHVIDGSAADVPNFYSRALDLAAVRVEEAALWAEKHFHVDG
jgi:hypothetical protein